ncbi:MAG: T9SS type A sorting domain-containing protein [Candidatus Delongbacteria bacterium]|nr:T9SS type A sorting domain-containing protein [Candidatus Delongbacteria bacterium]
MRVSALPVQLFRTALVISVITGSAQAITFTGDVPSDFTGAGVVAVADNVDVGIPVQAPPLTVSGWEVVNVAFELDANADELHIGLDFAGIAGDADGDGFEGNTAAWLASNQGFDMPNLMGTEAICIGLDLDQSGSTDIVAGVGATTDILGYSVSTFVNMGLLPFSFGAPLPGNQGPHLFGNDVEMTISNLSSLVAYGNELCFNFSGFSGSYADDGIGEDFLMGEVCLTTRTGATEDVVSGFGLEANYPNPFNPTTSIRFNMGETANAELAVFNMAGQKVATLVNGLVGAGSHEVTFDASNLSSGVYFYTLNSGSIVETRKMILTK